MPTDAVAGGLPDAAAAAEGAASAGEASLLPVDGQVAAVAETDPAASGEPPQPVYEDAEDSDVAGIEEALPPGRKTSEFKLDAKRRIEAKEKFLDEAKVGMKPA